MTNHVVGSGWEPRDPENGDFRFKNSDENEFDAEDWPADPGRYRPTAHYIQRFRETNRVLSGNIINESISGDQMVPALRNCGAFYTRRPGVVYYVVVGWDRESPAPQESGDRVVVTAWPWLFDREEALDSGRFSTRILNRIQEVNHTLFNRETADDEWLEYFEKCVGATPEAEVAGDV